MEYNIVHSTADVKYFWWKQNFIMIKNIKITLLSSPTK